MQTKKLNLTMRGFTLVELIIVIVILVVLVTVVIVFLNPAEFLARSRDTGRITGTSVLGRAVTNYYTTIGVTNRFPQTSSWDQELTDTQTIASFPTGLNYQYNSVYPCTVNSRPTSRPTYCYTVDADGINGALIYSALEASKNVNRCVPANAFVVYSTVDGKTGIICGTAEPTPWPAGTMSYIE